MRANIWGLGLPEMSTQTKLPLNKNLNIHSTKKLSVLHGCRLQKQTLECSFYYGIFEKINIPEFSCVLHGQLYNKISSLLLTKNCVSACCATGVRQNLEHWAAPQEEKKNCGSTFARRASNNKIKNAHSTKKSGSWSSNTSTGPQFVVMSSLVCCVAWCVSVWKIWVFTLNESCVAVLT